MTSFTAPRTWATGAPALTASAFNIDLKENFVALHGLNGYACRVYFDTDTAITTATTTALSWTHTSYNTGTMWVVGTPTRITVAVTGYYAVSATAAWHNDSTGKRQVGYRINGNAATLRWMRVRDPADDGMSYNGGYDEVSLTAGDYLEIVVLHTRGSDLTIDSGKRGTFATVRLLGDANAAAWTEPKTWSTGENLTLALLNEQVRDNTKNLYGLNGLACRLHRTVNTSLTNNADMTINWTAADWNIGSLWASASGTKVNLTASGNWAVFGGADFSANVSGERDIAWYQNGASVGYREREPAVTIATNTVIGFYDELYVSSTDQYLTMVVRQNSGAVMNLNASGKYQSCFGARYLGTATNTT